MGVINITPDSFSDGGKFNESHLFADQYQKLIQLGIDWIDIGGESTAPFNQKISFEEEKSRYDQVVIPNLNKIDYQDVVVSIDTYKSETFNYLYNVIKRCDSSAQIVWNDVSGVLDDQLFETLSRCPDVDYVFSHTNVSLRQDTAAHMENPFTISKEKLISSMLEYFESAMEMFDKFDLRSRIILDPCFGFSKSVELNHILIRELDQLITRFPSGQRWMIGISKKSFLKVLATEKDEQVEYFHCAILAQWMKSLRDYSIIFRIHDPSIFRMASKVVQLFDPKS